MIDDVEQYQDKTIDKNLPNGFQEIVNSNKDEEMEIVRKVKPNKATKHKSVDMSISKSQKLEKQIKLMRKERLELQQSHNERVTKLEVALSDIVQKIEIKDVQPLLEDVIHQEEVVTNKEKENPEENVRVFQMSKNINKINSTTFKHGGMIHNQE